MITFPKESFTSKINKNAACGYLLFAHCSFDRKKSKHDFYRDEDSMKKLFLKI